MDILAMVFLALLFIIGFVSRIPNKKMTSFFSLHSLFPQDLQQEKKEKEKEKEVAVVMKKKNSSDSSSTEKKAEMKSVFATFDKNKDGFITKQELSDSLKNIGISTSERDVVEMVQKVDVNGDGLIDFDEFCDLFESMMTREHERDGVDDTGNHQEGGEEEDGELKEAFDVFDGDKNGLISVEELGLVLDSLGFKEGKKLEDCREMIRRVDIDGDGMINFHEFKNMMKKGVSLISVS